MGLMELGVVAAAFVAAALLLYWYAIQYTYEVDQAQQALWRQQWDVAFWAMVRDRPDLDDIDWGEQWT